MKFTLAALALSLTVSTTMAQCPLQETPYPAQSPPFNLVLSSKNKTIDGQYLGACHTGAAIESFCLSGIPSPSKPAPFPATPFNFNTSDASTTWGVITYLLRGGNFNVSSTLRFSINPGSNVALPLLYPGFEGAQTVSFDSKDMLSIQGYDDSKPPEASSGYVDFYRWFACETYYAGYRYNNLVWVFGKGKPQNPTCVKVEVKRVFV